MTKRTIVKFTKPWNGYGPGEVAGFSDDKAQQLVDGGLAELQGKPKAGKAPAASKPQGKGKTAPPGGDGGDNPGGDGSGDGSGAGGDDTGSDGDGGDDNDEKP